MQELAFSEALQRKEEIIKAIRAGAIFVYPTDTVYGLGCNAELASSVDKIRMIKSQFSRPMSVIAPSFEWIYRHLEVEDRDKIESRLPGPFTFILKINKQCVAKNVSLGNTLGVRILAHDFSELIKAAGVPFVTTSANHTGEPAPKSIEEVSRDILDKVDYVIDGGELNGIASTVIDLSGDNPTVLRS